MRKVNFVFHFFSSGKRFRITENDLGASF